jgi:16S rRNA (cytosine967-C5)-methyltransferase
MTSATPARRLALRVLTAVAGPGPSLADRLAEDDCHGLDSRERAFLHELVLGTLRRRGLLDHALAPLLDRPLPRVDPVVLDVLRLGAHQLLHLRVPDRAAVSASVDLAREAVPRAAGFVNAVLRRLSQSGPRPLPDPAADPLGWLTTAGSLPLWLAERWLTRLGPEVAVARAGAMAEAPPVALRLNPRAQDVRARLEAAGATLHPLTVPGAFRAEGGRLGSLAAEGAIYLQDEGSQLVARLADGSGPVLDACAAPGGKASLIADLAESPRPVIAAELSVRRVRTMAALLRRWGSPHVLPLAADGHRPPFRAAFECVLVDAPCSGLGTLSRHPDLRWRFRATDLPRQAARQSALLARLSSLVQPGGRLVYATCSLEDEETVSVVNGFLAEHRAFSPAQAPDWAGAFVSPDGFLRTLPERSGGDGFFAAVMRKAKNSL